MNRLVRGRPTTRLQQEGAEDPDRDPQQDDQSVTAEGKDIADYDPNVDYEGSEPKVESDAQVEREVNSDAEHEKMVIPCSGTLHQKMMSWEQYKRILQVCRA